MPIRTAKAAVLVRVRVRVPVTTRISPTGWSLVASAVVLAGVAAVTDYAELAVLAVACVVTLLAAGTAVARPLRLDAALAVEPTEVARGEPAVVSVTLGNVGARRTGPMSLRLPVERTPAGPDGDLPVTVTVGSLAAGRARTVALPMPTERRGSVLAGPVVVRRCDTLGLVTRNLTVGTPTTLRVRPAVVAVAPLLSQRTSSPDGLATGAVSDGGITFHALREYVPGDDPRHVHWRSSAKFGRLVVRRYVDPTEPTSTVLLDTRREAYPADETAFEVAVDVAATVCTASARLRFPVRLCTTDGMRMTCRGGRSDDVALLDALTAVELTRPRTTRDADTGQAAGDGGQVHVLTGTLTGFGTRTVGTLTVVTGSADVGQLADLGPVTRWYEKVVVVRVGEPSREAGGSTDRAGPAGTSRPADASRPALAPGSAQTFGTSTGDGGLRVVDITGLDGLVATWPSPAAARVVPTRPAATR